MKKFTTKNLATALLITIAGAVPAQVNLTSGLTACYGLNGSASEPISNLTGTLSNVTDTIDRAGTSNSAFYFSGSASSYIDLPNSFLIKPNAISFSCWIKFTSNSNTQIIAFAHNGCSSYHEGYEFGLSNASPGVSHFELAVSDSTCSYPGQLRLYGNVVPLAQTWYHVGFYAGTDSLKMYVNGVLDTAVANPSPLVYDPNADVYLGGTNLPVNVPLQGFLDNVRFYNRKVTNAEMNALYTQDPACIAVSPPTAIAEIKKGINNFSVYPNPTQGKFVIEKPALTLADVCVYNFLGAVVLKAHFESGETMQIDLGGQPDGVYFVQLQAGEKTFTQKIIKQ